MEFDLEKQHEEVEEWNNLYSSLADILKGKGVVKLDDALYTMVKIDTNVYAKSLIRDIEYREREYVGNYFALGIENDEGNSHIPVYPQFELKTDGKIRDIILILMFIKDNMANKFTTVADTTIV